MVEAHEEFKREHNLTREEQSLYVRPLTPYGENLDGLVAGLELSDADSEDALWRAATA